VSEVIIIFLHLLKCSPFRIKFVDLIDICSLYHTPMQV